MASDLFKEIPGVFAEQKDAEVDILLELLASDASPLFRRLLDKGLINESSFGYDHFTGTGYSAILFSGESKDPKEVSKMICEEAERLRREGIDPQAFSRARKAVYGRNIMALNSAEAIANAMTSATFRGEELFRYIDQVAEVSLEDVQRCLEEHLLPQRAVLSVIFPKGNEMNIGGNDHD